MGKKEEFDNKKSKPFFSLVKDAINPDKYSVLINYNIGSGLKFFFIVLFFSTLLMGVLIIPNLLTMHSSLTQEMKSFSKFNIDLDVKMKEPFKYPANNPFIKIDLEKNLSNGANVLINKEKIKYKTVFSSYKEENLSDYKNAAQKTDDISRLFTVLTILIIPSLFLIFYGVTAIKYLLLLALVFIISYGALKFRRSGLTAKTVLNTLLYSSIVLIVLDTVLIPVPISKYLLSVNIFYGVSLRVVPVAIFLIFYILILAMLDSKKIRF